MLYRTFWHDARRPGLTRRVAPVALTLLLTLLAGQGSARQFLQPVAFQVASNTPIGRSLFVVGSVSELGAWDPFSAVKMEFDPSDGLWKTTVGLPRGETIAYKTLSRSDAAANWCNPAVDIHWQGGEDLTLTTDPRPPAPMAGKTVFYYTTWTNVTLFHDVNGVYQDSAPMVPVGPGRSPGEWLYRVDGVGTAGAILQFVPRTRTGPDTYVYDNAPYPGFGSGDYQTRLDAFLLRDGEIFNYWPSNTLSLPQVVTQFVDSSYAPTIASRSVRIYLPRGYAEQTGRRYPVFYFHDGQNTFLPGGGFGTWAAEVSATREISQGRMREAILVAVDNTSARFAEYCPPGDLVSGTPGQGNLYGDFLVHNVRPTIDFNYRTLNDPANTLLGGSSLGGLISAYLLLESNVFGKGAVMSPSFWTAPAFRGRIVSNAVPVRRMHLDWGTAEGSSMWEYGFPARAALLADGYVEGDTVQTVVGCGDAHNEAAWAARSPAMFRFLLDPGDEPNRLLADLMPVAATEISSGGIVHTTLGGWAYTVEWTEQAGAGSWLPLVPAEPEMEPWGLAQRLLSLPLAATTQGYFRVSAEPAYIP
jgi:predicted alpha/beta superfamily hydrolase